MRNNLLRAEMLVLFFAFLIVPLTMDAVQDTTAPQFVNGIQLSANEFNTENGVATLEVTFQATDDLSGVCASNDGCFENSVIEVRSDNQHQYNEFDVERVSGDNKNGFYKAVLTFPQYSDIGLWDLDVCLHDVIGNNRCDDAGYADSLYNTASFRDSSSPAIVGTPVVSPLTVNTETGNANISVIFNATDDLSGVFDSIRVSLHDADYFEGLATRTSGDNKNGMYQATITIPQYANLSGQRTLRIALTDNVENDNDYEFSYTFTNEGAVFDSQVPVMTEPVTTQSPIDTSLSSQNVTFTFTATDDLSGVCESDEDGCSSRLLLLVPYLSQEYEADIERVSGDALSGTYQATFTLPQYAREGYYDICYTLEDRAGNNEDTCSTEYENVLLVSDPNSGPELTEYSAIVTPSSDNTPEYWFTVENVYSEAVPEWGGKCARFFPSNLTFDQGNHGVSAQVSMPNGLYDDCTLTLHEGDRVSNVLEMSDFEIDAVTVMPSVNTTSWSDIVATSAIGYGTIIDTGGENPSRFIEWGVETGDYTSSCSAGTGSVGEYSCVMTNLMPLTTYYMRAKAQNSAGTVYGDEITFTTTADISAPTLTAFSLSPSSINTADNGYTITATITATDDLSGVEGLDMKMNPVDGGADLDFGNFTTTDAANGVYVVTAFMPKDSEIGTWDVTQFELRDGLNNILSLTKGELETRFGVGSASIAVIGDTYTPSDITAPILAQVTLVSTPTTDSTPDYTFNSTEAGTITYSGDCTSTTTDATVGDNTITFNELSDGKYDECTLKVTDAVGNVSNELEISEFVVDVSVPQITSIQRNDPTDAVTNAVSVEMKITFSEPVINVSKGDFVQNGTAASKIAQLGSGTIIEQGENEKEYLIHIPQTFDGTYYLELHHENDIKDTNDNAVRMEIGNSEQYDFHILPVITVGTSTKTSTDAITETISITDDTAISKDAVTIDTSESGAITYSDLSCLQTSAMKVDCTVKILTSGELVVRARDDANNASVRSVEGYVIAEKTESIKTAEKEIPKPDLSFSGKLKDAVLSSSRKLYVENDEIKFKGEYVEIAGGKVKITYKRRSKTEDEFADVDANGNWSQKVKFDKDGTYKIKFTFYDKNNKEVGEKGYYVLKIDTENPKFDAMPDKLSKKVGDKIWWNATDNYGVDEYKYYFNGKKEKTEEGYFHVPQGTPKGVYTLEIRAYDKAGNKDVREVTITVN